MHTDNTLFSQLLTEAIYKIKLLGNSSIGIVQDELGFAIGRNGGRAIEYWRQGNTPRKTEDIHLLADILVQRKGLSAAQKAQFLQAAGLVITPSNLDSKEMVLPAVEELQALPAFLNLPQNNFYRLVGRQLEVDRVIDFFERKGGNKIVGIDGMGGIGKTAITIEIANQCLARGLFSQVVWLSANQSSQGLNPKKNQAFNFGKILQEIAIQLGALDVGKLEDEEKIERIKDLFEFNSILVILDNLETADEPQQELLKKIHTHLPSGCFLLTSRIRFKEDIYHLHLEGLEKEASYDFLRQDASEKGIQHVTEAENHELEPVAETVGGSPLALKLIVSQLDYLPLDRVIHEMKLFELKSDEEYARFYNFILQRSWQHQNQKAQELLVGLACFNENDGSTFEAIQFVTQQPLSSLTSSIDALWQASLIEVGQDSIKDVRYYLHPLTTHFVLSDIVKKV